MKLGFACIELYLTRKLGCRFIIYTCSILLHLSTRNQFSSSMRLWIKYKNFQMRFSSPCCSMLHSSRVSKLSSRSYVHISMFRRKFIIMLLIWSLIPLVFRDQRHFGRKLNHRRISETFASNFGWPIIECIGYVIFHTVEICTYSWPILGPLTVED